MEPHLLVRDQVQILCQIGAMKKRGIVSILRQRSSSENIQAPH